MDIKYCRVLVEVLTKKPARQPGAQIDCENTISDIVKSEARNNVGNRIVGNDLWCEKREVFYKSVGHKT